MDTCSTLDRSYPENQTTSPPVITIDGPSGAGKGTLALQLAHRLGWHRLESGSLYRLLAWIAEAHRIAIQEEDEAVIQTLFHHFTPALLDTDGNQASPSDLTTIIHNEQYAEMASRLAEWPKLRSELIHRQRLFRRSPGLIAEGRDMGTNVFPDAILKIFLTAPLATRAHRRHAQLTRKGDTPVSLEAVMEALERRDVRDTMRKTAPLTIPPDALMLDSDALSITELAERAYQSYIIRIHTGNRAAVISTGSISVAQPLAKNI